MRINRYWFRDSIWVFSGPTPPVTYTFVVIDVIDAFQMFSLFDVAAEHSVTATRILSMNFLFSPPNENTIIP